MTIVGFIKEKDSTTYNFDGNLHTACEGTGTTESITSRSNTVHDLEVHRNDRIYHIKIEHCALRQNSRAGSRETETKRREEFESSNHLCTDRVYVRVSYLQV